MNITNINTDIQCQICYSMVYAGEERCIVHTNKRDFLSCILCGAAAERSGWCISV